MLEAGPATMKMYPRGFLGATLGARIEHQQKFVENNNGFRALKADEFRSQNNFSIPNAQVANLYNQYVRQAVCMGDFAFKRQLLTTAMAAFGTLYFDVWLQAQYKSPSVGDLHGRFLVDTLKFLQQGRRDMSLENWAALLAIPDSPSPIGPFPDEAKLFFGMQAGGGARWNLKLTEIIATWCSQPNGMEDLLGSLHILFGAFTE